MAEVELPNPDELKEIKGKKFSSRVALATAVFAVLLALASLGGNHAMKEMLLSQQQASDQWAYYQAKSIREHLYSSQKMLLENEVLLSGELSPNAKDSVQKTIETLSSEASRYARDKEEIRKEAERLETKRDENRSKDLHFEFAEVLLQIAIVVASVAIIAESIPVVIVSAVLAAAGAVICANAYLDVWTPLIELALR
jgi:small-conductance mechanosensitive channel